MACTILKVSGNGTTLIGNNEDGTDPNTFLWFIPASKGKYGRVYFTLSDKRPQGGMNDQGLFYDGTSGPVKEIVKSTQKPVYWRNLSEKMLEECTTVNEAIALLSKYNLSYFWNGQMFIADKYGNSAIIEGDTIIYSETSYQIATNFYHSNPELGGFPCYRYDIAESMIKNMPELSFNIIRYIMQAVHMEGYSFTQYSTIHDLQNLKIQYFKDSDFNNYIEIDLKKELKKGERWFTTKEFFYENDIKNISSKGSIYYNGTVEYYYHDSNLKCTLNFSNNMLNGNCEGYYQNGKKSWCSDFHTGKIVGTLSNWNESGSPLVGYNFINSTNTILTDYFPGGSVLLKLILRNIEDTIEPKEIIVFNEDSSVCFQGKYINEKFFINEVKSTYSGVLIAMYKGGFPYIQYEYENGLLHGKIQKWDTKGKIIKTEVFRDGNLIKVIRYD